MQNVEVERIVEASPDEVFRRYTDHAAWTKWAGLGRVSLAREGSPSPNGVGCVRVFHRAMNTREEVVSYEPPVRMTYRLVQGPVPIRDHFGEVLFEPHARGTRVVWRCRFDATVPLLGGAMQRFVTRLFKVTLARF